MQSLAHYERALKPIDQDSDSDALSVSDSDNESNVNPQKRMSTGGSNRSKTEDLAERLRATSISSPHMRVVESPPVKPPRPVESPPAKPPRPTKLPSENARYCSI